MKKSTRTIRSFVRREHRITPGQRRALNMGWPEYGLHAEAGWLEYQEESVLEIGFGMGHSLLSMAMQYPEKKFIGIEVHRPGIGALLLVAMKEQIKNIRVFNDDAVNVLKQSIKDESLSKIQIFFPDPWPKKRHQKRRLIQPDFMELLCRKLKIGGQLHLATDCQDYAQQMLTVAGEMTSLTNCAGEGQYLPNRNERVMTKFEQRGLRLGHFIWDLLFEKH